MGDRRRYAGRLTAVTLGVAGRSAAKTSEALFPRLEVVTRTDGSQPCAKTPEFFFMSGPQGMAEAKRLCRKCPFVQECLYEALKNDERFGVWGGMTPRDRSGLSPEERERILTEGERLEMARYA